MYACLILLALVAVEAAAIRWWLRREFIPPIFNGWAVLLYTVLFAVDLLIVWLITMPFSTGGADDFSWLPIVGAILVVVVALGTLFFRWIIRQEISGPSEGGPGPGA